MSKRKLTLAAVGAFLVLLLAVGATMLLRPEWRPFGDPVFTDEIPSKRPKHPDRRLLERFGETPMPEIIAAVKAERGDDAEHVPTASPTTAFLEMLPDAPLPFPEGAVPGDAAALKEFVKNQQSGNESGEPSPMERWQFNLALAALGVKPSEVPEAIRLETRPAPESDTYPVRLVPRQTDPAKLKAPLAIDRFGDHASLGIVADGGSQLYLLDSEKGLVAHDGLTGVEPGHLVKAVDFDLDGHPDLYVARRHGLPDSLLRNDGTGRFTDETVALGLLSFGDTTAVAWLDYDRDGLLDLVVGSSDRPLELYRQSSPGRFEPVAWDLKLWIPGGVRLIETADIDGDGYPDLFVSRDGGRQHLLLSRPAATWSDWRFEPAAAQIGFASAANLTTALFLDCDNDAQPDLLVGTATPDPEQGALRLYRNEGGGRFADITDAAGLHLPVGVLSAAAADLDLDGFDDLLVGTQALSINRVYANQGGTGYREVSIASRGSYLDETTSLLSGDLGDGAPTVLLANRSGAVRWLQSDGSANSWLRVEIPGQSDGLTLALAARDHDWVLHSYRRRLGSSSALTLGLGEAKTIERIEIFENGNTEAIQTLETIEPNQSLRIDLPERTAPRAVVPISEPSQGS